jgi:hypothetical protein
VVVTATISRDGDRAARANVTRSSMPGSVSMTIGVRTGCRAGWRFVSAEPNLEGDFNGVVV